MSHEEAYAALDAAALDALDAPERDAVLAHAETCDTCRAGLDSLRDVTAQLAFAAPMQTAPAHRDRVRSRLMARAAVDSRSPAAGRRPPRARNVVSALAWRRAEWLAIAASILLVVSVGVLASLMRDRQDLREALQGEVAKSQHTRDSLQTLVMSRDSLLAQITGPDVAMVKLASSAAREPNAMMFWDRPHNAWTFVAHNLPMPQAGRTYQLWLVTPAGAKISAGTFMPKSGEAMVRATYALARDSLAAVAVTDEPAGGMPQPTGQMVVVGTMPK
jgi:hypothetical protein